MASIASYIASHRNGGNLRAGLRRMKLQFWGSGCIKLELLAVYDADPFCQDVSEQDLHF
jgi:hypothetical protein